MIISVIMILSGIGIGIFAARIGDYFGMFISFIVILLNTYLILKKWDEKQDKMKARTKPPTNTK